MQIEAQTDMIEEVKTTLQTKVAGFEKAMTKFMKLNKESNKGSILSKRQEEFIAYVKRVVFKGEDVSVINPPDIYTQQKIVSRMKDL